jgi:hypothetical protein
VRRSGFPPIAFRSIRCYMYPRVHSPRPDFHASRNPNAKPTDHARKHKTDH